MLLFFSTFPPAQTRHTRRWRKKKKGVWFHTVFLLGAVRAGRVSINEVFFWDIPAPRLCLSPSPPPLHTQ